jgi:hypothetical protein
VRGHGRHQRDARRSSTRTPTTTSRSARSRPEPAAERRRHPDAHRARSAEVNPVVRKEAISALGRSKDRARSSSRHSFAGGPDGRA